MQTLPDDPTGATAVYGFVSAWQADPYQVVAGLGVPLLVVLVLVVVFVGRQWRATGEVVAARRLVPVREPADSSSGGPTSMIRLRPPFPSHD